VVRRYIYRCFSRPTMIWVRIRHGRQRTQTLRTPTILESEQLRLRDKTINGMLRPSILLGNGSPGPLRESFSEALHAACMTAMISGPRYGSTVGTSLVITANSSVWATRPNFAYGDNTRQPSDYSADGRNKLHISKASPNKKTDKFFSSWEYFSKLRVMPTKHDNATLGAVRKQCQASPALLALCPELQITGKRSRHDTVNSPAPGHSSQGHPHCL
jgi:hypothetical protein